MQPISISLRVSMSHSKRFSRHKTQRLKATQCDLLVLLFLWNGSLPNRIWYYYFTKIDLVISLNKITIIKMVYHIAQKEVPYAKRCMRDRNRAVVLLAEFVMSFCPPLPDTLYSSWFRFSIAWLDLKHRGHPEIFDTLTDLIQSKIRDISQYDKV